jgi:hypothetical protein
VVLLGLHPTAAAAIIRQPRLEPTFGVLHHQLCVEVTLNRGDGHILAMVRIPAHHERRFRSNVNTDSDRC